jgi:vancomycin resistance protein YoaR
MTGGGRKTNLQRLLDAEDKELRAKYRDPRVIEQKKRESAQARKEQAEKEEQEKQAAKQKRKKELSEQRREAMLKRLAGYREKRSKMARERKTKEAKEKQQKKKKAKIAKDFNLGFKLWKHKKPVGVVLYPDSYLEQMKNEIQSKISKDSSVTTQPILPSKQQRFNDFKKVYPDEIKRSKQIREKNLSVSRQKTTGLRKQKRKIDCINIFPEPFYNSTNIVKRYLPYNLKTSDIVKIILKEDNTLGDAADIGYKRGTSLRTLQSSYNINKTKD